MNHHQQNTKPATVIKRINKLFQNGLFHRRKMTASWFKKLSAGLLLTSFLFGAAPAFGQGVSRAGLFTPGYILDMAFYYYFSYDYRRAIEYFKVYVKLEGDSEVPLRYLGRMYYQMDRLDTAIYYLERAQKASPKSFETLYLLGEAYLQNNDIENGLKVFETMHELDPGDLGTLYMLTQIYHETKDTRREMIFYRKLSAALIKQGGFSPLLYRSLISLAKYYYTKDEYRESLNYFQKIHELNPDDFKTAFVLAQLYKVTGQFRKSVEIEEKLFEKQPDNLALLESLVESLYILDDIKVKYYYEVYEAKAQRIDSLMKAIGLEIRGEREEALKYFKRASRRNKGRLSLHVGLYKANNYDELADKKQAAFLTLYLSQQINAVDISLDYGAKLYKLLQYEAKETNFDQKFFNTPVSAENYDEKMLDLAYHYVEFFTYHGTSYDISGKPKLALTYLLQALNYVRKIEEWLTVVKDTDKIDKESYDKKYGELIERKGGLLASCGWLAATSYRDSMFNAEALLTRASQTNPDDARAYFFLGYYYQTKGDERGRNKSDYEKSEKYFLEAIEVFKKNSPDTEPPSNVYFYLGIVSEKLGKLDQMESYLEKAIAMEPYNSIYLNYLGYLYSIHNLHLDKAYEYVKIALEEEPENAAYLDTLGWILYKMEKYEEALGHLLYAKSRADDEKWESPLIVYHIAETYFKLGNLGMAKLYYQRTLDIIDKADEPLDEVYIKDQINSIKSRQDRRGN